MDTLLTVSGLRKRYRLSDMELDFVSLVARGDDPLAQVVLSKADPDPDSNDPQEGTMGDPIAKNDLDPEVVAYIDGLEDEVDALSKQVEDAESENTDLKTTMAKMAPKDAEAADEISKALLAKADPAVRALIEKQEAALAEATSIAKAERDMRVEREFIAKAAALPMINTATDDLAGLLRRAADSLTADDVTKFEQVLKAANAQIAEGNLFTTFGSGGGVVTVSASAEAKAAEINKAEPALTHDQALAKAYEQNPALLAEAMTEQEG